MRFEQGTHHGPFGHNVCLGERHLRRTSGGANVPCYGTDRRWSPSATTALLMSWQTAMS